MPKLPLPPITGAGVPIDSGDLPVSSQADVAAIWASDLQQVDGLAVRDAIQQGQLASALEYQRKTRGAAAQSDPLRATGEYQDEIFGFERGINRAAGESNAAYRTRGNAVQEQVAPDDIVAAANAILAPVTSVSCRYAERSDGLFLSDPSPTGTSWSSHLFQSSDGGPGATPNYPDRQYGTLTHRRPPGAFLNGDGYGRWFLLRVPQIDSIDASVSALDQFPVTPLATLRQSFVQPTVGDSVLAVVDDTSKFSPNLVVVIPGAGTYVTGPISSGVPEVALFNTGATGSLGSGSTVTAPAVIVPASPMDSPPDGSGFFLGNPTDGTSALNASYLQALSSDAASVYQSIADAVEAIRGHSMRWTLISDPNLT